MMTGVSEAVVGHIHHSLRCRVAACSYLAKVRAVQTVAHRGMGQGLGKAQPAKYLACRATVIRKVR